MKLFFRNAFLFLVFLFLFTEIIARIFHISTDASKTFKNSNRNINYYPSQEGYWDGGSHKWYINELGYPGKNLPKSYENLVLLIGDSYIQNFMNPDSCRQREYLSKIKPKFNYLEASMSGLNLLGYFEYSKALDSLNPSFKVIYVSSKDFLTNIKNGNSNSGYQVNLETKQFYYPKYRGSSLKDFIYNFKFIYYLYRKNISVFNPTTVINGINKNSENKNDLKLSNKEYEEVSNLLDLIKINYKCDNVFFVFHPNSSKEIISLTRKKGFRSMEIVKNENENWKTKNHGHWNCFGHHEVAKQVSIFLDELSKN